MADNWLRSEIADGLEGLIALGLEGQPAAEVLPLTADMWLRAIQRGNIGCNIESIDAPRIREGFDRLWSRLRRWPVPAQLIEQIPPRPKRPKLPQTMPSAEDQARGRQALQAIYDQLTDGVTLPGERP